METMEINLLAALRPELDATLEAGMEIAGIPEHMQEGLLLYLRQGIPAGSFLTAILSNDFFTACAHADGDNQHALFAYARFLSNVPAVCYGSPAAVAGWLKRGSDARRGA